VAQEEQPIQGVGGPFVTVATFCERVLEEADGVSSLVRMVDRYLIERMPDVVMAPGTKAAFDTVLFVNIKSGDFRGPAEVTVKLRAPSGRESLKMVSAPLTFEGGEQGNTVVIRLTIVPEETGIYWADVEVDGRLLTRAPLRVEWRSKPASEPEPLSDAPDAR